jgi:hypothetical protein
MNVQCVWGFHRSDVWEVISGQRQLSESDEVAVLAVRSRGSLWHWSCRQRDRMADQLPGVFLFTDHLSPWSTDLFRPPGAWPTWCMCKVVSADGNWILGSLFFLVCKRRRANQLLAVLQLLSSKTNHFGHPGIWLYTSNPWIPLNTLMRVTRNVKPWCYFAFSASVVQNGRPFLCVWGLYWPLLSLSDDRIGLSGSWRYRCWPLSLLKQLEGLWSKIGIDWFDSFVLFSLLASALVSLDW